MALYEEARRQIRDRILSGQFPPGSFLSEESLSRELGMSRTPIRQALTDLVNSGLVERIQGRGCIVRKIDLSEMLEIMELGYWLVEWGVRRITERPDLDLSPIEASLREEREQLKKGDMHATLVACRHMDLRILELAGNRQMLRIMSQISDLLIYEASYAIKRPDVLAQIIREHQAILDAIAARNPELAVERVREHFQAARRRLLALGDGTEKTA